MENNKNKFNILFADNNVCQRTLSFLKYVFDDKDVEVVNSEDCIVKKVSLEELKKLKKVNLIVFTGGEDVDPSYYGQIKGKFTHTNPVRDNIEINVYNNFSYNTPKLGICRGAQLLTVLNGGSLIQHVEKHNNSNHKISIVDRISEGEEFVYNIILPSDHHQMMYPFNIRKENYEIIGQSKFFLSETYLNGNNEEILLDDNFVEPEIVYYNQSNSLAIQAHPEWINNFEKSIDAKNTKQIILQKLFKK